MKLDHDVFTDEASQEVTAEIHPKPRLEAQNVAIMDDALIVHYNDQLYIVNPPPCPEQPVLFVNDGGQINGVYLKGKSGENDENVIYELDNKKPSDNKGDKVTDLLSKNASDNKGDKVSDSLIKKPSDNEGDKVSDLLIKKPSDNEGDKVSDLFSGASDVDSKTQREFLSADEDNRSTMQMRVIKKDGCKTDFELERFEIIKYKTEEAMKPAVGSDIMKKDVATEDDAANTSITKQDTVTEDANKSDSDELDKRKPDCVTKENDENGAANKLNYHTEAKSHSAEREFDMKCFYCDVCPETFWTEGGLGHHTSVHLKKSPFDPDKHKEELDAERNAVESKHEKPKETIENGNEGMIGNEGKNPQVIVLESNGDEPK